MEKLKAFLKRKNIEITAKRYGIDALGAMAQGLFASLLIGTIINTVGTQFGIEALTQPIVSITSGENVITYTVGGLASAMSGPAMACAIGYALQAPPLVLFSLITVGFAANALGGAGGRPRAEVVEVGRLGRGRRARRRDTPAWVRPRVPLSDSSPVTGRGLRAPSQTRCPGP